MNLESRSKIPLRWAAQLVSNLCDQIDESPTLQAPLLAAFRDASIDLTEAIERRKATMWALDGALKAARGARAEIDAYVQKLKRLEAALKAEALAAMTENPNLPWKDSMGRKLTLAKSQPSLRLPFDLKEERTFTNLIHEETVRMFEIPSRFLKLFTISALDTAAVKKALLAGETLSWAELEMSHHVRGLMPKKDQDHDE